MAVCLIFMNKELINKLLSEVKYPGFSRDIISFGILKNMDINDKKEHWSDRHWKLITVVAILSLVGSFALLVIFGPSLR